MDQVRDLIVQRLKDRGISMKEASERLGRNAAYIQQFVERGVPKKLPEDVRPTLADMLGIDEHLLRSPQGFINPQKRPTHIGGSAHPLKNVTSDGPEDTLKVLGMAEGGQDGWAPFNGETVQFIRRPDNLLGVPNAYAVFIKGSSMEPRYRPGELVHVHPGKPVRPGDYVLVQRRPAQDGEPPLAVVKLLVRRTASKLILGQHNPNREVEVPAGEVVSIHRIVGSSEA